MKASFVLDRENSTEVLQRVTDVLDVKHVAVLDAMGLCLLHSGPEPVSTMMLTDWTVVARSAFAACDDLGVRCGAGNCEESLQTHQAGGTLMRSMSGGMLLVVQYGARTPVGTLRMVAMEAADSLVRQVESRPVAAVRPVTLEMPPVILDGSISDPFAGGSWWAEDVPSSSSGTPTVVDV